MELWEELGPLALPDGDRLFVRGAPKPEDPVSFQGPQDRSKSLAKVILGHPPSGAYESQDHVTI